MDEAGHNATMFKLIVGDQSVLFTGHIYPELNEAQMEAIGRVDVMVVPVGGNGYTIDPVGALKLIKEVEPKLVIPTHYAEAGSTPLRNVEIKLGKQKSVKAALDESRGKQIVSVMPVMTRLNGGRQLRIPLEAGYDGEVFEVGAA